jgi:EAL domain-containing protein (putative c-di-GMP-specific phosphodiesterase class I)
VPPNSFIPVAERYGLMGAIDRWVIRTALQWCTDAVASNGDIEIAINLSAAHSRITNSIFCVTRLLGRQ